MATGLILGTDDTNYAGQRVIDRRVFKNMIPENTVLGKLLRGVKGQQLVSDSEIFRVLMSNSFQVGDAGAGASIPAGGRGKVLEMAITYYMLGMPIDIDDDLLMNIDPANMTDAEAVLLNDLMQQYYDKGAHIMQWIFAGNGTGELAIVENTAIVNGLVYLDDATPSILFDTLLTTDTRVDLVTRSTGVIKANDSTGNATGYIISADKVNKTITIGAAKGDSSGSANLDIASPGASTLGVYFYGLYSSSGGSFVTKVPDGLLKLGAYHPTTSSTLYGYSGAQYAGFQPNYVACSSTTGLTVGKLNEAANGIYAWDPSTVIATDQIVAADFEERTRASNTYQVQASGTQANIVNVGVSINGRAYPMDAIPYWNGKGIAMFVPLDTLRFFYKKSSIMQANGDRDPGWQMRFPKMHPSDSTYTHGNQMVCRIQYGVNGLRNRWAYLDGLQTTPLN